MITKVFLDDSPLSFRVFVVVVFYLTEETIPHL